MESNYKEVSRQIQIVEHSTKKLVRTFSTPHCSVIKDKKKKKVENYVRCIVVVVKLLQSCPTLCNPIDGSPPGSPVPGIL